MLKKISAAYFSPTGNTRKEALALARAMAEQVEEIDLSVMKPQSRSFSEDDVIIAAGPVFGGRIPASMAERLKEMQGGGAAAVTLAVYGNRAYEDALLELNDCMKELGFRVIASAALIAQHSIVTEVAEGRPDEKDLTEINEFAEKLLQKYTGQEDVKNEPEVPGGRPYKEWKPAPVTPAPSEGCGKCGLCAEKCPTQAIERERPDLTDASKCIQCMRCVSICPVKARALPGQVMEMFSQKLSPLKEIRRENEFFL